jgi:hypothetical protein
MPIVVIVEVKGGDEAKCADALKSAVSDELSTARRQMTVARATLGSQI